MHADQQYLCQLVRAWAQGAADTVPAPAGVSLESVAAGLIAHNVDALLGALLPDSEPRAALVRQAARSRTRTELLLLEYERLLPILSSPDCDPILLKGAALALTNYERPSDRWFLDLDVLVPPEKVDAVCARLESAGYRYLHGLRAPIFYDKYHLHRIMLGPQGAVVEIHWDLTLPGSVYRHDLAKVFNRAAVTRIGRRQTRCAAAIDQILHGVYQNIADGFIDLRRICDLVLLTRALSGADWDQLVMDAHNSGMNKALWLSLYNMKLIAGEAAPGEVMSRLEPGPALSRTLRGLRVEQGCLNRRAEQAGDYVPMLHYLLTPSSGLRIREMIRSLRVGEELLLDRGHQPGRMPGFGARTIIGLSQLKILCLASFRASRALLSG